MKKKREESKYCERCQEVGNRIVQVRVPCKREIIEYLSTLDDVRDFRAIYEAEIRILPPKEKKKNKK